ncbi:MAG: hypothetical protein ABSB32_13725 [Thermodesulfobacteriota bacterium]|jgi:hypothetical protein
MALGDRIKEKAEEGLEALKEGVVVFLAEAGKQSRILKKKMELSSLKHNVRRRFIRLGSTVYDIHLRGEREVFAQAEVKDLIDQLEGYQARVREIELEIEAIKQEKVPKVPAAASEKKESPPPVNSGS